MGAQITAIVFSSNKIRAYEIEQDYLSAVQDPEPLVYVFSLTYNLEGLFAKWK